MRFKEEARNAEQINQILMAIISIACALVSAYLVPWIKANTTKKQLEALEFWTETAVRFAKQTFTPEQWKEKKEAVTAYMLQILHEKIHANINEEDLDKLIEGIYNKVKEEAEKGQLKSDMPAAAKTATAAGTAKRKQATKTAEN